MELQLFGQVHEPGVDCEQVDGFCRVVNVLLHRLVCSALVLEISEELIVLLKCTAQLIHNVLLVDVGTFESSRLRQRAIRRIYTPFSVQAEGIGESEGLDVVRRCNCMDARSKCRLQLRIGNHS